MEEIVKEISFKQVVDNTKRKYFNEAESLKASNEKARQLKLFREYLTWKSPGTEIREYLGVEIGLLREWLESNFSNGMTWENYGTVWVVDHIVPLRMFDLFNKEDLVICWHYKNLMPLLWEDNEKKNGNVFFSFELLNKLKDKDIFFMKLYERVKGEVEWMAKYIEVYHNKYK